MNVTRSTLDSALGTARGRSRSPFTEAILSPSTLKAVGAGMLREWCKDNGLALKVRKDAPPDRLFFMGPPSRHW